MSYANVAAHNAPPPALQPHADPGLLNIVPPTTETVDVDAKVHVVPHDYKETLPEPKPPVREILLDEYEDNFGDSKKDKAKKKANKGYAEAKAEGEYLWDTAKHYLLRPGVAGGLIGIGKALLSIVYRALSFIFFYSQHWYLGRRWTCFLYPTTSPQRQNRHWLHCRRSIGSIRSRRIRC